MGILGTIFENVKNKKRVKKIRSMSKNDLLALNDEDFCYAIECVCEDAICYGKESEITEYQVFAYSLIRFEAEVNNGGLCQFFVNSSRVCAPYISEALGTVGANGLKELFDNFISENEIDVNDLSSFIINDISEYEEKTKQFDFDSFDNKFYENDELHQQIIDYSRKNVDQIVK